MVPKLAEIVAVTALPAEIVAAVTDIEVTSEGPTVTIARVFCTLPVTSEAVPVMVYEPVLLYACDALGPAEVLPSPQSMLEDDIVPELAEMVAVTGFPVAMVEELTDIDVTKAGITVTLRGYL